MLYRISERPCLDKKTGYYYYRKTRLDVDTLRAVEKWKRPSLGTKNEEEAKRRLKKIKTDLLEWSPKNSNRILYNDFVKQYDKSERIRIKDGDIKESTHIENMRYLEKLRQHLEREHNSRAVYLSEVTARDARTFLEAFTGRLDGQSGKRARQYARALGIRAFDMAYNDESIEQNPFRRTSKITMKQKKVIQFTPEELSDLLSKMPDSTYELRTQKNAIRLDYNTGLRRENLKSIKLKDVHRYSESIVVLNLPTTKNGDEHRVPLEGEALHAYHDQIANLIQRFGDDLDPEMPLFSNKEGRMLFKDTISKWISKAIKRYAPELTGKTFHCLRKTTAGETKKLSNLRVVKEILGQSDEKVAQRYYLEKEPTDIQKHSEVLKQFKPLTKSCTRNSHADSKYIQQTSTTNKPKGS